MPRARSPHKPPKRLKKCAQLVGRHAGLQDGGNALHALKPQQVRQPQVPSHYSTLLYSTLLYYTILYYTILYYTILYYTILYYAILYYTILYYTILYYTILYYTILYYTILYYTIVFAAPSATLGEAPLRDPPLSGDLGAQGAERRMTGTSQKGDDANSNKGRRRGYAEDAGTRGKGHVNTRILLNLLVQEIPETILLSDSYATVVSLGWSNLEHEVVHPQAASRSNPSFPPPRLHHDTAPHDRNPDALDLNIRKRPPSPHLD